MVVIFAFCSLTPQALKRGREKLHYLNPVPIHDIGERWISKFDRSRLQALSELKKNLEAGEA